VARRAVSCGRGAVAGRAPVGEPLAQNITHQDAGYDCSAAQEFLPVGPARRPRPQL